MSFGGLQSLVVLYVNWVMAGEMTFITAVKRTKENMSGSWPGQNESQKKRKCEALHECKLLVC